MFVGTALGYVEPSALGACDAHDGEGGGYVAEHLLGRRRLALLGADGRG